MAKKGAAAAEAPAVDFSKGDSLMVDFGNVEEASFEVLPKGMYPCVISDCEFVYSQSGGNPMWTLTLEVRDGEFAGRKLFSHLVFEGKGMPFTKATLSRIAPELLAGPFDPKDEELIASMLGKELKAKVMVRKYEGEDTNNVRGLFADAGDGGFIS